MIGINDLFHNISIDDAVSNYGKILETVETQLPDCKIFIESVIPENNEFIDNKLVRELNGRLMELADQYGNCTYIDLSSEYADEEGNIIPEYYDSDGAHLNGAGYTVWLDIIKQYLPS